MHADDRSAQVIVHEFQVRDAATAGDPSDSAIPVFQVASKLARDAVCETGWKNVNQRCFFTPQANACFIWAQEPPQLSDQEKAVNQYKTLKSWGDPISEEELVSLSELDEYEHVDPFDRTLPARKLFSGSLYGVIPQPHFYSSASDSATIRDGATEIPPYKKAKPITIPPYGDNVSQLSHPLSAFARAAWIIPVRGSLPWTVCTPAVVLDDREDNAEIGKEGVLIQWTKTTLVKFWHFLKNVREAGNLGQVGISFHVATARERGESWLSAEVIHEPTSSAYGELQVWSQPLSSIDYIKVYHKASNAMGLRNILDAWAYVCPDGRKSRVLKGSRLALVDERCRGILVS